MVEVQWDCLAGFVRSGFVRGGVAPDVFFSGVAVLGLGAVGEREEGVAGFVAEGMLG